MVIGSNGGVLGVIEIFEFWELQVVILRMSRWRRRRLRFWRVKVGGWGMRLHWIRKRASGLL